MDAIAPGKFKFINLQAGFEHFQKTGKALPEDTVEILENECDGAMFGAVSSPSKKVEGYSSPIVALRKKLDLYANIRPVATLSVQGHKNFDMVIVRENTECLYVKSERIDPTGGPDGGKVAWADRKISEYASRRIATVAFNVAQQRGKSHTQSSTSAGNVGSREAIKRPKVTIVHKANVLSVTDGLFRETCLEVANEDKFKNVDVEEQIVDSMVYRLFKEPHVFDVIVAPNLYGDIISDGAAALVGSLGLVASANMSDKFTMGEPVHGSGPDIAGKGIANPIASIRSAALLLENLGMRNEASRIQMAVEKVLCVNLHQLTPDLGGNGTTKSVTKAIVDLM